MWSLWCQEMGIGVCGHSGARENQQVPKCLHGRSVTTLLKVFPHSHLFIWEQSMPGPRPMYANQRTLSGAGPLPSSVCRCQGSNPGPQARQQVCLSASSFPPHPHPCPRKPSFVPVTVANNYIGIRNGLFLCSCSKKENRIL